MRDTENRSLMCPWSRERSGRRNFLSAQPAASTRQRNSLRGAADQVSEEEFFGVVRDRLAFVAFIRRQIHAHSRRLGKLVTSFILRIAGVSLNPQDLHVMLRRGV